MRAKNIDHARQLLRKAQNDRKNAVNDGRDYAEVCAEYDPRIQSLEEMLRSAHFEDDWRESDGYRNKSRRAR